MRLVAYLTSLLLLVSSVYSLPKLNGIMQERYKKKLMHYLCLEKLFSENKKSESDFLDIPTTSSARILCPHNEKFDPHKKI
ncbi:hypothetical protein BpHYR1_031616 [Brachionus plicatilis]|uniref:Uncharacterized protein n=1 Tax=Brachionus plicatilis TaxID=10195 RepID=A0A3M7SIX2_BRAPC|nr:hypothetical protein BpHYR1_031616 [Brachionus plicatilis]